MSNMQHFRDFLTRLFYSQPYTYVSLGDSTVEGLGASSRTRTYPGIIYQAVQKKHPQAMWYNLGVHDYRVRDVIKEKLKPAILAKPSFVTISIGANDIRKATTTKKFTSDLNFLLSSLRHETSAQIVMNTIPDFSVTPAVPKRLRSYTRLAIWRFNRIIAKEADKAGVLLVDLYPLSKVYADEFPEIISEDGFHPNDFGYAIWANTILSQIQGKVI